MSENVQALNVGDRVRVKVGRGTLEGEVRQINGDNALVYLTAKGRDVWRKLSLISKAEQIAA